MKADDEQMDDHESPDEVRDQLLHDLKTNGARCAYDALVAVCKDGKAPAPAKATAGVALLRAAGFFTASDERTTKADHEMTPEELQAEIDRLGRQRRRLKRGRATADGGGGVFD